MSYYSKLAEKRNDTVKRGNLSYGKYEIKKEKESFSTKGFAYVGYVYSDDGSITKTAPRESIEECERDIMQHKTFKAYNSKEKSNSVVTRGTIHSHRYEVERVDYLGQATYIGYVYDKEGNTILKTNIYMKAGACEQEIKSKVFNSKENSMNYYEKISKEKENSTFKYLGKSWAVNKDTYKYVKAQVEQTYRDRIAYLEEKKRSAQSTEKAAIETEIRDIKAGFKETLESLKWGADWDNSKEKSYYAKIAEKKNAIYKPHTVEEDAGILEALKPIVESLAKRGMSPKDIAIYLEKKPRVTPVLARQAVQWYFY